MAEGKKSFIAYSDWKGMFEQLPDEIAGKLIKHVFRYVNDENPISDDFMINALFEPIKNTLKRDLEKWEKQTLQRIEAGKLSAEKRANDRLTKSNDRSNSFNETQRNSTVSVSDSVSVSVNDSVNEIKTNENNKNTFRPKVFMCGCGFDENLVNEYLQIRKSKKHASTKTTLSKVISEIEKTGIEKNEMLKIIIEKTWSNFEASFYQEPKEKQKTREGGATADEIKVAMSKAQFGQMHIADKYNLYNKLAIEFQGVDMFWNNEPKDKAEVFYRLDSMCNDLDKFFWAYTNMKNKKLNGVTSFQFDSNQLKDIISQIVF